MTCNASGCRADLVRSSRMWIITDGRTLPNPSSLWPTTACLQSGPRVPVEHLVGQLVEIEPPAQRCVIPIATARGIDAARGCAREERCQY
jgi:hypothetical protein